MSTLADLTLVPALEQVNASIGMHRIEMLLSDSTQEWRVRAYLRCQNPFPSNAIGLLVACMCDDLDGADATANLSGYSLSVEQVLQVLASRPNVEELNLCFNEYITARNLPKLLEELPSVHRLVFIGCTSIQETELVEVLRTRPESFFNLNAPINPSLMRIQAPLIYPVTFTIACSSNDIYTTPRFLDAASPCSPLRALFSP